MGGQIFESVERTYFSTAVLEQRHQFEFFTEEFRRLFSQREFQNSSDTGGFPAEIAAMSVGESKCIVLKGPARTITRSHSNIRADDDAGLYFSFLLNGELEFEGPGGRWALSTGHAVVVDNRTAHQLHWKPGNGSCDIMSLLLPRGEYGSPLTLDRLADRRFFSHHKFAPLLKLTLRKLVSSIEKGIDAEITALLKISETLLKFISQDRYLDGIRDKCTLVSAIELEIEAQVLDPDFTLPALASALNVSARQVQRVMAGMETTFSEYVRNKRLSMAMAQLQQPHKKLGSIERIALACGFNDLSTFYRAFKARYGCTPGDIRHETASAPRT